ncbi:MAG TPA: hypothetical protein DEA96_18405 [Leptospiraceae bacterium]|nr:hypothetical protein [Spirochaetaceae bacterium]HBS06949.1 hypothetical protein [Leptospiraceae bacterium]
MKLESTIQKELETTGLRLTFQGKRFELLHGLILKGARLEKEQNGRFYEVAEFRDLVLDISYLAWATGGQPLRSVRSYNGRLYSNAILSHRSGSFLEELRALLEARNLEVHLQNIAWETAGNNSQSGIRADLDLEPGQSGMNLDFRFHGDSGEIRFHGDLNNEKRRIFITLSEVPLKLLMDFMRTSDSVPSLQILPRWTQIRGELNGKGSMDLRQPGTAINLNGEFHSLFLDGGEPLGLRFRNLQGTYHFSQVHSYEEGVLKSDIEILASPYLETKLHYNRQKNGLPHRLEMSGKIRFQDMRENQNVKVFNTLVHCEGDVEFKVDSSYNQSLTLIDLEPDVRFHNLQLYPPISWPGGKESLANLDIHLTPEKKLSGKGTILGAPFTMDSTGSIDISRIADGELRLVQNFDHSITVDGLSYEKLTQLILHTHSWILERASRPDARKAEDQGPLWENEFIDMPLYTQLLAGLNLKGSIRLINLKGGSGLPRNATLRISSNPQNFNLTLDEDRGEPGILRGRYMGVWNEQLPSHTLSLNIKQKEIQIDWPEITGKKGPTGVSIDANFSSSGLYPADLMNYSNGQIYFEAYEMDMKSFAPFELALKMLGKKIPDGPVIGDIEVVRSGTGQEIEYYRIVVETDTLVARGGGRYTIYEGGKTWLKISMDGYQDTLNFQVQKNGKWLPDDGL